MAKVKKATPTKTSKAKRVGRYDDKLAFNGSFLDVMKAAAKNANDKSEDKKKK